MNSKSLIKNRKMLAIITGVVLCATFGLSVTSYASADSNQTSSGTTTPPTIRGSIDLKQMITSSIKTKFSDAANTAASAVSNGMVIGGQLTQKHGYLVYQFKVVDDKNMIYSVIVDAGTGQVLNTSQGHTANVGVFLGMDHHGYGMHKFHMKGLAQQPTPQQTQPQSDQQSSSENTPLGT